MTETNSLESSQVLRGVGAEEIDEEVFDEAAGDGDRQVQLLESFGLQSGLPWAWRQRQGVWDLISSALLSDPSKLGLGSMLKVRDAVAC